MGVGGSQRLNGPWRVEIDFSGHLDRAITPDGPGDVAKNIEIINPPVPVLGGVWGAGLPLGLIVEGAGMNRSIKLPVFEWTGVVRGIGDPRPFRNQYYFALTQKFEGVQYRTPRLAIGKVALFDEYAVCSVPVGSSILTKRHTKEMVTIRQKTIEETVGCAVLSVIGGDTVEDGTYDAMQTDYEVRRYKERHASIQYLRKILPRLNSEFRNQ